VKLTSSGRVVVAAKLSSRISESALTNAAPPRTLQAAEKSEAGKDACSTATQAIEAVKWGRHPCLPKSWRTDLFHQPAD